MSEQTKKPTAWDEFNIDSSIAFSDPLDFAKSVVSKAAEFRHQLTATSSIVALNSRYKTQANLNLEAKKEADEFIKETLDKLSKFDPEVLVHLLPQLPKLVEFCDTVVHVQSMRSGLNKEFSKKRLHQMYIKLRKMYEAYCQAMESFAKTKFPLIPAVSGNYSDTKGGVMEHIFEVDGEVILNYYHAARLCEFEANSYMDVVEKFQDQTEINGHKVRMVEL